MRRALAILLLVLGLLAVVMSRGGPVTYYEGALLPPGAQP
jgi:hypothetical protein